MIGYYRAMRHLMSAAATGNLIITVSASCEGRYGLALWAACWCAASIAMINHWIRKENND
jgi:hypothetical protein